MRYSMVSLNFTVVLINKYPCTVMHMLYQTSITALASLIIFTVYSHLLHHKI